MNINEIKNGKAQFNCKEAQDFRNVMGKYYTARHSMNDEILQKNARIKSYKELIESNKLDIEKKSDNPNYSSLRSIEEIEKENKVYETKIFELEEEYKSFCRVQAKRLEKAESLVHTHLYNTYRNFILKESDNENVKSAYKDFYIVAIATFLTTNGVIAGLDTCEKLAFATGRKNTSAKQALKTGKLTSELNEKAWRKLFLNTLSDLMCKEKAFNPYKYNYVLPEKKNK